MFAVSQLERISWTLSASVRGMMGLGRKTQRSPTPLADIVSPVYPEMKSTLRSGMNAARCCAKAGPFIRGMMTSVITNRHAPACICISSSASTPSDASGTW